MYLGGKGRDGKWGDAMQDSERPLGRDGGRGPGQWPKPPAWVALTLLAGAVVIGSLTTWQGARLYETTRLQARTDALIADAFGGRFPAADDPVWSADATVDRASIEGMAARLDRLKPVEVDGRPACARPAGPETDSRMICRANVAFAAGPGEVILDWHEEAGAWRLADFQVRED